MRISSKALLGFMLQQVTGVPACSPGGWAGSLRGVRVGQVHGLGWTGDFCDLPTPALVLCAGCVPSMLFLFLTPQEWLLLCGVCTLLFVIFSDCTSHSYF